MTITSKQPGATITVNALAPASSRLFKPIRLGSVDLQHRIVLAPLTRYRNDKDHVAMDLMVKYYADRASVPGTLIISEATPTGHDDEGVPNLGGVQSEAQVRGWARVIEAVHAKGSFYFQQLYALGRASEPDYLASRGYGYKSSSAVAMDGTTVAPAEMTEEDIQNKIEDFVSGARNMVRAGADGVEIHGAHGYLIDQFISDSINKRTDRWGGTIENRARFLLTIVKRVVNEIGAERVAIRLSPFAAFQGAESSDIIGQYSYIVKELKGMDVPFAYLSLVEATGDPGALIFNGKWVNQGMTLDFILDIWYNQSPVIVAGGYQPETAACAVEERYMRWNVLVAFGRHFLANPDLVFRIRNNIPLNKYNRATFYIHMSEVGYNDYPFSGEFISTMSDGIASQ
ncbi:hypothetical protein V1509DRAFT_630483 [Lipomyces kononenkoae]